MSISQLALWDTVKIARPSLGSLFQETAPGDNPCLFLGKVGCNYQPGMDIWDELYYWHVVKAHAERGQVIMTCKVIGYAGVSHDMSESAEDDDC